MKTLYTFLLAFVFFLMNAQEQQYFYLENGDKVYLSKIDISKSKLNNIAVLYSLMNKEIEYYQYEDGAIQSPDNYIFTAVNEGGDIKNILSLLGVEYSDLSPIEGLENTYRFFLDSGNVFDIAAQIYQTHKVKYAEPSFYRYNCFSADYSSSQWGLKNTGQFGGSSGYDINVYPAWNITKGSSSIRIAVLDSGTDLQHPDLAGNLLTGYDAVPSSVGFPGNGGSGSPWDSNYHGTACTGIIGALDNGDGVIGVAPNCKIIPVRISYTFNGYDYSNDSWIVSAFNYVKDKADVISCSWKLGSPSNTVTSIINTCYTNGRLGKGCVICFATGNDDASSINPLAFLPSTIAVGAISNCGERKSPSSCDGEKWGSNYGVGLSVMAPGVKIYTTDIHGASGKNSGDYMSNFNGTSAACPHVSGIAALILSIQPSLTAAQVSHLLKVTARKIGSTSYEMLENNFAGTWNSQMGHGLVDAYAAVQAAKNKQYLLTGQYSQSVGTWSTLGTVNFVSNTGGPVVVRAYAPSATNYKWEVTSSSPGLQWSNPGSANESRITFTPSNISYVNFKVTATTPSGTFEGYYQFSIRGSFYSISQDTGTGIVNIRVEENNNEIELIPSKRTVIVYSEDGVMLDKFQSSEHLMQVNLSKWPNNKFIIQVDDGSGNPPYSQVVLKR